MQTKLAVPTHEARTTQTALPFLRENTENTIGTNQLIEVKNKQLSLNSFAYLVTLAVDRTSLGAERGCTGCSSPALVALALQRRGVAPAMTTAGSRAQ